MGDGLHKKAIFRFNNRFMRYGVRLSFTDDDLFLNKGLIVGNIGHCGNGYFQDGIETKSGNGKREENNDEFILDAEVHDPG